MVNIQIEFDELLKAIDQLSDEVTVGNKSKKPRVLGLHPGAFQPSDDFDDLLPDEF